MSHHGKILRYALAIFVLVVFLGCPWKDKTVPDHLLGTWRTSDPKYADRFFQIEPDHIIFGTGAKKSSTHPIAGISTHEIARIKENLEGPYIFYSIYYLNEEGQEYQFSFFYNPESNGPIRFKNQIEIAWTKRDR